MIIGMVACEVDGNIRAEVLHDPLRELLQVLRVVIELRNDQVGDLYMDPEFPCQDEGVQHGLNMCLAHLHVKLVPEALQVDIHCIKIGGKFPEGLRVHVAVCNENGVVTMLLHDLGSIVSELVPDGGLVVGEGHSITGIPSYPGWDCLRPPDIPEIVVTGFHL